MKTYRIHLIRHGLTQANLDGRYVGSTDLPVTAQGLAELRALNTAHAYPAAARCYSSPLSRCRQTLEVLYPGVPAAAVEGLREWDFGVFENKTPEELKDNEDYRRWIADSTSHAPPGGEHAQAFFDRVGGAFSEVVYDVMKRGEPDTVICTHGGVIMAVLALFGLPERPYFDWACGNGRGYTVRVTPSFFMRTSKVEVVAEVPRGKDAAEMQGAQRALFEQGQQI
jgi:alpha-ribazole phosphatase